MSLLWRNQTTERAQSRESNPRDEPTTGKPTTELTCDGTPTQLHGLPSMPALKLRNALVLFPVIYITDEKGECFNTDVHSKLSNRGENLVFNARNVQL